MIRRASLSALFLCLLAACLSFSLVYADSIKFDPELSDSIQRVTSNDRIAVWIELEKPSDMQSLKSNAEKAGTTRESRYAFALSQLKTAHEAAQKNIARFMTSSLASAAQTKMKQHWLVNIIEANLTSSELDAIAARSDVVAVHLAPQIVGLEETEKETMTPSASGAAAVENNLKYINADDAWAAGYTGAGRLICSFDTGIRGSHLALKNNWKGNDGDSAAAWFDPAYNQSFPHTITGSSHGTHVMGLMCGHNDTSGDTIGVALGAKWISAAVVDIPGASIIDAFEWAADPDGDPNTMSDVPDVINHSWGVPGIACTNVFFDLIDYTEALGIVNIFAAGNDGSANMSIRNPANRAQDSIDCFAVGNLAYLGDSINNGSSRGPSNCNVGARKPNVVAPGTSVRSAYGTSDNVYGNMTGTSMATPEVAGLVALLRQKNPDATVDEIKTAILTTARTFGSIVPGNTYGWGVIDCMAALNAIPTPGSPALRVNGYAHVTVNSGDTARGLVTLTNIGTGLNSVTLTITGSNPSLTVLSGTASFGTIGTGATNTSTDSIRLIVSDTVTEGSVLAIGVTLSGSSGYSEPATLCVEVGSALARTFVTHTSGDIDFTISNFGVFGLAPNSFYPLTGAGFNYKLGGNDWYESGLMICNATGSVSDGIRNIAGDWDGDFRVMPGGNISIIQPGQHANQETFTRMNDSRSEHPIGIEFTQESFSFGGSGNHDFVILRYILKNVTGSPLNGLYVGIYMDWDLPSSGFFSDVGGWDSTNEYLWVANYPTSPAVKRLPRAAVVLDGTAFTAHTGPAADVSLNSGGFTETEKFNAMQSGFSTGSLYTDMRMDLYQILVAGPVNLTVGGSDTVSFAIVAADSLSQLPAAVDDARQTYTDEFLSCCKNNRGNVNNDLSDAVTIVDLTYLVNYLFRSGPAPVCLDEANVNGDAGGALLINDVTYLVNYLFRSGPIPPACP